MFTFCDDPCLVLVALKELQITAVVALAIVAVLLVVGVRFLVAVEILNKHNIQLLLRSRSQLAV